MAPIMLKLIFKRTTYTLLIVLFAVQLLSCTSTSSTPDTGYAPQTFEDDNYYTEVTFREQKLTEDGYYVASIKPEPGINNVEPTATTNSQFIQYNPTAAEILNFLSADKTDLQVYKDNEYLCSHFASSLNNAAETQGIRCAVVIIRFPLKNHVIVGFETTDEGMLYFEPQTDEQVWPVIGKEYYQCIKAKPGFHYEKPDYNDTIIDVIVCW
jgi:hypothetical protein